MLVVKSRYVAVVMCLLFLYVRIIIKDMAIILAYNLKKDYNVRIIIKYRDNIHAHNLEWL